jgi:3-deoxy-D-manno-octulosonic-acid transferase
MQIYASSQAIELASKSLTDQALRKLFQERYDQLKSDDYQTHELVHFWVVESAEDLLKLPPIPECKEEHPRWTELVFVLLDDGFGLEVFVPDHLRGFIK